MSTGRSSSCFVEPSLQPVRIERVHGFVGSAAALCAANRALLRVPPVRRVFCSGRFEGRRCALRLGIDPVEQGLLPERTPFYGEEGASAAPKCVWNVRHKTGDAQVATGDENTRSEQQDVPERPPSATGKPVGVRLFLHRSRRQGPATTPARHGTYECFGAARESGALSQRRNEHRRAPERVSKDVSSSDFIQVSSQVSRALQNLEKQRRCSEVAEGPGWPSSTQDLQRFIEDVELRCAYLGPIGSSLVRFALERSLQRSATMQHSPARQPPDADAGSTADPANAPPSPPDMNLRTSARGERERLSPDAASAPSTSDRAARRIAAVSTTPWGVAIHEERKHRSFARCRAVLNTVIDLQMDLEAVLAAALLDTPLATREIASEFGRSVADILIQERAIRGIIYATSMDSNPAGLRQLLIGVAKDWRALALFFAGTLHELRVYSEAFGLMDDMDAATWSPDTCTAEGNAPQRSCEAASSMDESVATSVVRGTSTASGAYASGAPAVSHTPADRSLNSMQETAEQAPTCVSPGLLTPREASCETRSHTDGADDQRASLAPARQRLDAMTHATAQRLALLTLEVVAPLANQLGIYYLQCEMEELAFLLLFPKQSEALRRQVALRFDAGADILEYARQAIENALSLEPQLHSYIWSWRIRGRVKSLYSTYRKMIRLGSGIDSILDLMALRVVVRPVHQSSELEACDAVMAIIERLWPSVRERRRDFIRWPKENGYQSLHTTVVIDGFPVEVQVRSERMHRLAEYGRAAHWLYKQNLNLFTDRGFANTTVSPSAMSEREKAVAWNAIAHAAALANTPCAPSVGEFEFESNVAADSDAAVASLADASGAVSTPTAATTAAGPSDTPARVAALPATQPPSGETLASETLTHSESRRADVILDDTVTASLGTTSEYFRVLYHQIVELEQHVVVFDKSSGKLLRLPRGTTLGDVAGVPMLNGDIASPGTVLRTGDQIGGAAFSS